MPQARYSIVIQRPVDDVFAFVADGERCPEWRPSVLEIKRVAGNGGAGTRYAQTVAGPMNRRISADYEITIFEPSRRLEFRTVSGPARPHGSYEFESLGGGTRLTFSLDAELGGLQRLLMSGAVQKTMDAEIRTLDNLKALLEA
jgi:carbon monoxide dehydrogenase subunit G